MSEILLVVAVGLAVVSVLLLSVGVAALRRHRWLGSLGSAGAGALILSLAALSGVLGLSTQGYRGLVAEELAVTVTTVPVEEGVFQAYLEFPDGRLESFRIEGDQFLVDAHILKWHPLANVLGIHTLYELDRLSGRYIEIEDERAAPRTVHTLKTEKPVDLFQLARRYSLLALLVDTEYGSATYVQVDRPSRFEVTVSTTGLLVRETGTVTGPPD
ncbi:MAG: hypothetical protein WD960_03810 [Gemmatimonadota bacterium]